MSEKKIKLAIEVDSHFVKMLNATVQLKGLGNLQENYQHHTAADVLAVVVLAEARGALEEQVHAMTPIEWRPHIQTISEFREVEVIPTPAGGSDG